MFVSVRYEGDGSDQPDHKTATKTIALLRKHKDRPFFIAAGFVRPHYPMVAPQQYFDHYRWRDVVLPEQVEGDLDDIPKQGLAPQPLVEQRDRSNTRTTRSACGPAYYAAVTFMDAQVGRILDELDRLGLRESTAVVFTSDHGYHLGDHTFWLKSNVHEQVTRVPLILSIPGVKPGRTGSIVELVDLFPTLSELAGLKPPAGLHGTSLVPVLDNREATVRDGAVSFARRQLSWRNKHWSYMRYDDGSEELYDMRIDSGQLTNLAKAEKHGDTLRAMAAALDARLKSAGVK